MAEFDREAFAQRARSAASRRALQRKQELVESYKERLKRSNGFVIFFNFQGIDAYPFTLLRLDVKDLKGEIVVARNTLLWRAFSDTALSDHRDIFIGPTAALFAYEDPVAPTKKLVEFLKKTFEDDWESRIKGGLLDGRYITPEQVKELAELPSKEELIAKLLALMMAPVTNLALVLKAVPQKLVLTLKAIEEAKSKEGGK
ncbi:MAG: 50S ribosomal protein L10 [Aquificae bacterium]|nr:50S ribosomal protein L10 [Aquificota bacterium]